MEKFIPYLLCCNDAAYVVDEETKQIVWLHDSAVLSFPNAIGKPCWKALLGKDEKCAFCPELTEASRYSWEYYDSNRELWCKVSNLLFTENGKKYRAGIIGIIDDAMKLNHDTVEEMSELQTLLRENRKIKDAFEHEASHDRMTGLFNRNRYRLDVISGMFDCGGLGVAYLDLNNLKKVNDTYRHEAGDELIDCLSREIKAVFGCRADSRCYRVGGDEFVVLLKGMAEDELKALIDEFKAKLDLANQTREILCEVAVGLAFSAEKCDVEALVTLADNEMYRVKRAMKGI